MKTATSAREPWTLRRRIVVGTTAVIAIVLLASAAVSAITVASSVTAVVDSQLQASISSLTHTIERLRDNPEKAEDDPRGFDKPLVDFTGHAPGTVIALLHDGEIIDSAMFTPEQAGPCPDAVLVDLTAAAEIWTGTHTDIGTLPLGELGQYRMAFHELENGDTAIAGISLDIARQAVARNTIMLSIVSLLAIAFTVGGVMVVTRLALRPLNRVAAAATAVSSLPLDKGSVSISSSVEPFDADDRTEVGRVGAAFQRMIDHVDSALAVREGTDRRMRRFVTDASHELRTPLAAILGYAELTRQENSQLPDLTENALARIESEATRMSSLVSDLLLLARIDEGQDMRLDQVELGELVSTAVSDAQVSAPEHTWLIHLPYDPVIVCGDHERLHQVVVNLLSNARVHTPVGTTIETRVERVDVEGEPMVELSVTDDGPGIDAALVPDLFERFTRADESRSRAAGSTGLGLAIVSSIVERHGGRVRVDSQPGRTTFFVLLPASGIEADGTL